jgi:hypothetical protein
VLQERRQTNCQRRIRHSGRSIERAIDDPVDSAQAQPFFSERQYSPMKPLRDGDGAVSVPDRQRGDIDSPDAPHLTCVNHEATLCLNSLRILCRTEDAR